MNYKHMVVSVMILLLLYTPLHVFSTGIPVRHQPYDLILLIQPGNNLINTIKELEEKVSDERLKQALAELEEAIRTGDPDKYNAAAENLYNLLSSGSVSVVELSPEDLKLLASLTSSLASGYGNDMSIELDPDKYKSLLESLYNLGVLDKESVPLDDISGVMDASRILGENIGEWNVRIESTGESFSLKGLPNLGLPQLGTGGGSALFSWSNMAEYLGIVTAVVIAGLLLFTYRSRIQSFLETSRISKTASRYMSEINLYGKSLREKIIYCYQSLVRILSILGYHKKDWETPREYAEKLKDTVYGEIIRDVTPVYEKAAYTVKPLSEDDLEKCTSCIKRVTKR